MASGSGKREGKGALTVAGRARSALLDGDYALARTLAKQVIDDASAAEGDKTEARDVLDATQIDRGPIIAGVIILAVLLTLFAWVITQKHG